MLPPPRVVTLVLCTPDGVVLGELPPFEVATPWWQEAEPVVSAARATYGIEIVVLRLLEAASTKPHGGSTTYLAELASPIPPELPLAAWTGTLDDDPLRMSWARPGGPAADLAWATQALRDLGLKPAGPPVQVRSWNLSSLWRLPLASQTAWLKVVPPFFDHEGAVLAALVDAPVPRLLAHDGPRILMAEIPGADLYDAGDAELRTMVSLLVDLQRTWIGRTGALLALGLPDRSAASLTAEIAEVVERTADLEAADRATLTSFVEGLPARFAAVAACGLPDTLVHGDFHPGNTRGTPDAITVLDWGDSGVGHPLLDEPAFLDRIAAPHVQSMRDDWHRAWAVAVPGSDPAWAASLLRPVATASQAVAYRMFLDRIEPSERPYHAADPTERLHRAAEQLRDTPPVDAGGFA